MMNSKINARLTLLFLMSLATTFHGIARENSIRPLLMNLDYRVKIDSNNVEIDLSVENFYIKNRSPYLVFYIGNIKLKALEVTGESAQRRIDAQIQGQMLFIGPFTGFEKKVMLHYAIQPGDLSKHGHQGYLHPDYGLLAGEQFLLLPAAGRASRTEIQFEVPEGWQIFLPPISASNFEVTQNKIITTDTSWTGFYQLVKNCYIFGKFSATWTQSQSLTFLFSKDIDVSLQNKIQKSTMALVQFNNQRFHRQLPRYTFCFAASADDSVKIMGGVGPFSMGFTFSPNEKRDWQLLAHRLFHVYFDQFIGIKALHLPPDIWFLEGLATFYEIIAPENLKLDDFGIISYRSGEEFKKLYHRYLYFRIKDPELFQLIPAEKVHLLSGQTEFLHYTQAPLLILTLHSLFGRKEYQKSMDILWQQLDQMKSRPENSLETYFKEYSDSTIQNFWRNHVAGDDLLDLRTILSNSTEKNFPAQSQNIINELKVYQYLLSTWFQYEPEKFLAESIFANEFSDLLRVNDFRKINFADPDVEKMVFDFSPTIFYLLKIHRLRLHVCKIDPTDPARNFKLAQKENLEIWKNFLAKLNINK